MTDTIEATLITKDNIEDNIPLYRSYPVMGEIINSGPDDMQILKYVLDLDTLSGSLAAISPPDNDPTNFTTANQVYLVSDNAGDTDKTVYIIGQKDDNSFGKFTYTTDDSDGTTYVDCGTWHTILTAWTPDTVAGTVILTDDESSTTTYFTLTSGGAARQAQFYVPNGYYGNLVYIEGGITAVPGTVGTDVTFIKVDDISQKMLNYYHPNIINAVTHNKVFDETEEITIQGFYNNAMVDVEVNLVFMIWK
jgi:hypothetical protein